MRQFKSLKASQTTKKHRTKKTKSRDKHAQSTPTHSISTHLSTSSNSANIQAYIASHPTTITQTLQSPFTTELKSLSIFSLRRHPQRSLHPFSHHKRYLSTSKILSQHAIPHLTVPFQFNPVSYDQLPPLNNSSFIDSSSIGAIYPHIKQSNRHRTKLSQNPSALSHSTDVNVKVNQLDNTPLSIPSSSSSDSTDSIIDLQKRYQLNEAEGVILSYLYLNNPIQAYHAFFQHNNYKQMRIHSETIGIYTPIRAYNEVIGVTNTKTKGKMRSKWNDIELQSTYKIPSTSPLFEQTFYPISIVFTLISQLLHSSFPTKAFRVYQIAKQQLIHQFFLHYSQPTPFTDQNTTNPLPFPPSLPFAGLVPILLDAFAKQIPSSSILTTIQQLHADAEECALYSQQHHNFELYRRNQHNIADTSIDEIIQEEDTTNNKFQLDYIYSIQPSTYIHNPSKAQTVPLTPSPYPYPFILPVPSILTLPKRDIQQYTNSIIYSTAFAYIKAADYYAPSQPNLTAQFDRRTEKSNNQDQSNTSPINSASLSSSLSPSTSLQKTNFSRQVGPRVNSEQDFFTRLMFNAKSLQRLPPQTLQYAHDRVIHALKTPLIRLGKTPRHHSLQKGHPTRYQRPTGFRLHSNVRSLPPLHELPFLSLSHQAAFRNTLPTALMLNPSNPLKNTPIISHPNKTRLLPYFLLPLHNMKKNPFAQTQELLELASTLLTKHVTKLCAYGEQVDLFSENPSQLTDPLLPVHVLTQYDISLVLKSQDDQKFDASTKTSTFSKIDIVTVPDEAAQHLRDFIPPTLSLLPRHSALFSNMLLSTYMKLEQHDKIVQFIRNLVTLKDVKLLHGDLLVNQTTIDLLFTYITTHCPSTLSQLSVLIRLLHHTDTQKRFERAALSESLSAVNSYAPQGPLFDPNKHPNRLQLDIAVDERGNVTGLYDVTKRRQYQQQLEMFRNDPALRYIYQASKNLINVGVISHASQISVPGQPDINRIQQLFLSDKKPNSASFANAPVIFANDISRSKRKIRSAYEIYGLPDPSKSYPIDDKGNIDILRALQPETPGSSDSPLPVFSASFHFHRNNLFSNDRIPILSRYRGLTTTDFPRMGGLEPVGVPLHKTEREPFSQLVSHVSIVPPESSGKLSLLHQRRSKELSPDALREEILFPTKPASGSVIKSSSSREDSHSLSDVMGPDGSKYNVHLSHYSSKPITEIAGTIPQQAYTYQVLHSGQTSHRMLLNLATVTHPHHNHIQPEEFQQITSMFKSAPIIPQTYLDTYVRDFNKFHSNTGEHLPLLQSIFHSYPPPGDINSNILYTKSQYTLSPDKRLFLHQARDGSPIMYLSPYQVNAALFGVDPSPTIKNVANRTESVVFNIHYKPSTVNQRPSFYTYKNHPHQKDVKEFAWHMSQQTNNSRFERHVPNESPDMRFQDFHQTDEAPSFQELEPHYWGDIFSDTTSVSIFRLPPPTSLGLELIDRNSKIDAASLHRYKQLIDRHRTQNTRNNHPNPSSKHLPMQLRSYNEDITEQVTKEEEETGQWVDLIYDFCSIMDSYGGDISLPILSLANKMASRHNYFEGELSLTQQLASFQKSYQIADVGQGSSSDHDLFGAFLNHDAFDLLQDSPSINTQNASPTSLSLSRHINSSPIRFNESKLYFDFFVENKARTNLMMSTSLQQHPSILYGDFLLQTSQVAHDLSSIVQQKEHDQSQHQNTPQFDSLSLNPSVFFPQSSHFSHYYKKRQDYYKTLSTIVGQYQTDVQTTPVFGQETIAHPNLPSHPLAIDQPNLFHLILATTPQTYPQAKVAHALSLLEDYSRANQNNAPRNNQQVIQLIGTDFTEPVHALQWYTTAWLYLTDSLQPPSPFSPSPSLSRPPSAIPHPGKVKSPLDTLWFNSQHHLPKLNEKEVDKYLNQNSVPMTLPNSTHGTFAYALRLLHGQQFSTAISFVIQMMSDRRPISRLLRDTIVFYASQNGEIFRSQPRAVLSMTPQNGINKPLHHNSIFWSIFNEQSTEQRKNFIETLSLEDRQQLWDLQQPNSDELSDSDGVDKNLTNPNASSINMLRAHIYYQDEMGHKGTPNGYFINRRRPISALETKQINFMQNKLNENEIDTHDVDFNPRHLTLRDPKAPLPITTSSVLTQSSISHLQSPRTVFEIPHTKHYIPSSNTKLWTDISLLMTHDKWCGFLSSNEYIDLHKTLLLFDFLLSNHSQLGVFYSSNRKSGGASATFPINIFNHGNDLNFQLGIAPKSDCNVGVNSLKISNVPLNLQPISNKLKQSKIPTIVDSIPTVSHAAVLSSRNDLSPTLLAHTSTPNTLALTLSGLESSSHNNQLYLGRIMTSLDRPPLVPLSYMMTSFNSKPYSELPQYLKAQSLMTKVSQLFSIVNPRKTAWGEKIVSLELDEGMIWGSSNSSAGTEVWDLYGPSKHNYPHYLEHFQQSKQLTHSGNSSNSNSYGQHHNSRSRIQKIFNSSLHQLASKAFALENVYTTSISKHVYNSVLSDNAKWWEEMTLFLEDLNTYQPHSNLIAPASNRISNLSSSDPKLQLNIKQRPDGSKSNILYAAQTQHRSAADKQLHSLRVLNEMRNFISQALNHQSDEVISQPKMLSHSHNRKHNLNQLASQDKFYWLQQRTNIITAPLLRHSVHYHPFPDLSKRFRSKFSSNLNLNQLTKSDFDTTLQSSHNNPSDQPPLVAQKQSKVTHNLTTVRKSLSAQRVSQAALYNRLIFYKQKLNPANQSIKVEPRSLKSRKINTLPTSTHLQFNSGFQYYSTPDFQLKAALLQTLQLLHDNYQDIKTYPRLQALLNTLEDRLSRPLKGTNRLVGVGQKTTDVYISPTLMHQSKTKTTEPPLGTLLSQPLSIITRTYLPPHFMTPFRTQRTSSRSSRGVSSDLQVHKHFRRRSMEGIAALSSIHNLSLTDYISHSDSSYNGIVTGSTTVLSGTGHRPYKQETTFQFSTGSNSNPAQRLTFTDSYFQNQERDNIVDITSQTHPDSGNALTFDPTLDQPVNFAHHQSQLQSSTIHQLRPAKIPYHSNVASKHRFNMIAIERKFIPTPDPNWIVSRGSVANTSNIGTSLRLTQSTHPSHQQQSHELQQPHESLLSITKTFPTQTTKFSNPYLQSPSRHFVDLAYQRLATGTKYPLQSKLSFTSELIGPLIYQSPSFSIPVFARIPLDPTDVQSQSIPTTKFLFFSTASFSASHGRIVKLFSLPPPLPSQFSMDSIYAGGRSFSQFDDTGKAKSNTNIYTNPTLHPEIGFNNLLYMTLIFSLFDESLTFFTSKPELSPTPLPPQVSNDSPWSTLPHIPSIPFHYDPTSALIDQLTTSPQTMLPLYSFDRSPTTDTTGHTLDYGHSTHIPFAKPAALPLSATFQHLFPLTSPSLPLRSLQPQSPQPLQQSPFQLAQSLRLNALLTFSLFDDDISQATQPIKSQPLPLWLEYSVLSAPFDDNKTPRMRSTFTRSISPTAKDLLNTGLRDSLHSHEGRKIRDRAITSHENKTITAVRDALENVLPPDDQLVIPQHLSLRPTLF